MGQYYRPIAFDKKTDEVFEWLSAHTYDNGLKLMEHSYLGNSMMQMIEGFLVPGGRWYGKHIVWEGDYAEPMDLYNKCNEKNKIKPRLRKVPKEFKYVVNQSEKTYVDKSKIVDTKDDWGIHPLSLLTCEGNGQGGGDFYGEDPKGLVGSWARDIITVESEIPEGYKELIFDLNEN